MKGRQISTYIYIVFLFILIMVSGILGGIIAYHNYKTAEKGVISRLDVALEVAKEQILIQDTAIDHTLSMINNYEDLDLMIETKNYAVLNNLLTLADSQEPGYYLITDENGVILCSDDHPIGTTWELSYLLNSFQKSSNPLHTTEILSAESVNNTSRLFKQSVKIKNKNHNTPVMLQLVIYPIYDGIQLQGALIGGFSLNNNSNLAYDYTKSVPDTYLSVSTNDGLRICSNIDVGDFSYLEGSIQDSDLYETTNKGNRWQGKVYMDGTDNGIVVADPIYNNKNEVIGNIGVGAPTYLFPDLGIQDLLFILMIIILLVAIASFILKYLSYKITAPIRKLQKFSRSITDDDPSPEDIVWNEHFIPVELHELSDDLFTMSQKLISKNFLLEKRVEERTEYLMRTVEDLQEVNQYKSQFLANISHELRTPLNSIIGFASILHDELFGSLNGKQKKYVSVILESGNHLLTLINDLLDMVKTNRHMEKLSLQTLNVADIIETVSLSIMPLLQSKNQELVIDIEPDDYTFTAKWDEKKIRQLLLNLLSNANKFTSENQKIQISLRSLNDEEYSISVIDTGIGISDDLKTKVFLPFEQVNSSFSRNTQGVGLGLAICKNLVDMHQGKIWLEDNPLGGLIVRIILPVHVSQADNK